MGRDENATEDARLVDQCLEGNPRAYMELVRKYQLMVYGIALRMLGNVEDAEDVAQECFVRAFEALDRFDKRYKFSSWIYRIAANLAVDWLRRRKPHMISLDQGSQTAGGHERMAAPVVTAPASSSPDAQLDRAEAMAAFEKAVERLAPDYKAVIVLRYQRELSYEEIAEVLRLPIGTVKTRIHRARQILKRELEPFLDEQRK